jgi:O-6-methylguanine DNA methyltransferase
MTPFERRVLTVVSRIPVGRVATYGDVARMAGKPGAARAVGNIMRRADRPGLPYHRVIGAGGALGGYSNLSLKRSLLSAEGLVVTPRRVVGFARIRWVGPPPLAKRATARSRRSPKGAKADK